MVIKSKSSDESLKIKYKKIKYILIFNLAILILPIIFPSYSTASEKTIGVILTGNLTYYRDIHDTFMSHLAKEGYADKIKVIMQRPSPDYISIRNAVRLLISRDVDIIITYGALATVAAIDEKIKTPLLFINVYESLATNFKAKNITGITVKTPISSLLRYLKGLTTLSKLAVAYSSNEEETIHQLREIYNLSGTFGFRVEEIDLKTLIEAKKFPAHLAGKEIDAIFITSSSIAHSIMPSIIEFARNKRIPTASMIPDKNTPSTITLCPAIENQGRMAANKALKIIEGIEPKNVKIEPSYSMELIFNLKEAKALNYGMPIDLITEATKLIN